MVSVMREIIYQSSVCLPSLKKHLGPSLLEKSNWLVQEIKETLTFNGKNSGLVDLNKKIYNVKNNCLF